MKIIAGNNGGNCKKTKKSVERPELTAPITTKDGRPGHKRMPLQML